jgi:sugar diacid utilization regulator
VSLPSLVDGFLSAARIVWAEDLEPSPLRRGWVEGSRVTGEAIFRATDTALAAVARGFEQARGSIVRQEESMRRELVDDLLVGTADTAALVSRAERFGLHLTAPHSVLVAVAGTPLRDDPAFLAELEPRLRPLLPGRSLLLATKEGRLVVVAGERTPRDVALTKNDRALKSLLHAVSRRQGDQEPVRLSVGPLRHGPTGISESYRSARQGAVIAERLDWPDPIVRPEQTVLYEVLLRDRQALTILVDGVLGPLLEARGGAAPLVATLVAYRAAGGVATETARQMNLSVRAVTYRLARIKNLTGWDPTDPAHSLTLQTAAEGAILLGWPGGEAVDVADPRQH